MYQIKQSNFSIKQFLRFFICISNLREDIDDDEYNETKEETLAQLREFEESLVKATAGDMTLDDNVTSMKLVS